MFYTEVKGVAWDGWRFGPFPTRKEAQWRGEYEVKCAGEIFEDERAILKFEVVEED